MSDELDYTINDPSEVQCPYCLKVVMGEEDIPDDVIEYDTICQHCGRAITLEIEHEITVIARKSEGTE